MAVHIAGLEPVYFQEIKAGKKRTEYRVRKRPDKTIESLDVGTPIVFFETGGTSAILCACEDWERWDGQFADGSHGFEYRIKIQYLRNLSPAEAKKATHQQGWRTWSDAPASVVVEKPTTRKVAKARQRKPETAETIEPRVPSSTTVSDPLETRWPATSEDRPTMSTRSAAR